jgi:predicted molibdopterin-dependent oxidoreductase YjgC
MEGTFVNHEGRVQRFQQALVPPGVARPAWMILRRLLALRGEGEGVLETGQAFEIAAREAGALADLKWMDLGPKGKLANMEGAAAPAAK